MTFDNNTRYQPLPFISSHTNPLRICQVVASINEQTGGTAFAVTSLAEVLANQGICSYLFTLDYQQCGQQVTTPGVKVHSYRANRIARYIRGLHPVASRALWELAATELDLIHNHGLWMFPNLYARQSALKHQLPFVISTHGMLSSWSIKFHHFKKCIAWFLYEYKNLLSATVFHATSFEELLAIRSLGFRQPIAIIPNGVEFEDPIIKYDREILTQDFPELKNKKWLLFLSRIHPKKGVYNLLLTWNIISEIFDDWHLIIAGPDSLGYQTKLELLVAELGVQQRVTFTGMLSADKKKTALSNANLFVLPTYSENFGIAIAEALAYGVPVITTKGAPWEDLLTYDCGWWIENTRPTLAAALTEAMQLSDQERQAMGLKGRNLVKTQYSWDSIAQEMSKVYQWIIRGYNPPNSIHF
ncbi:glycosyl transferases group 1 family protein [Lyngbya aestuarii BL J]|uniref:Glycosyl transferases group 1 family protein n=1 Tax=Lyngbya aestuarii BL J TaxID=1348334 RepID=U7QJN4_9CYAN|nr:glycosyltransferase [Lyngbya aestuarii]ERT08179.1 glycosyl transferases group 1 family protein [Lyngbya aestuarii BL J]